MTDRLLEPEKLPGRLCDCGTHLDAFWPYCPNCARAQTWNDVGGRTGRDCPGCGWMISALHSFCPWCRAVVATSNSSRFPRDTAPGFRTDAQCDHDCGGGVQYPMPYCPWCGGEQEWYNLYEGVCAACSLGVDDAMDVCPWCAGDATGGSRIRPALAQVDRLLAMAGVTPWGFRVLLRPGVSGVDPAYPKIVEIDRAHVGRKPAAQIEWSRLVGLIVHELGHSFLYHHWRWATSEGFRQVFGDVELPYQVPDNIAVDFRHRRLALQPTGHVSHYARFHPQEDFAETFRFYVTRAGRLDEIAAELEDKGKGPLVYARFRLLHDYLSALAASVG